MDSWTDTDGWSTTLFSNGQDVAIRCNRPKDASVKKSVWLAELDAVAKNLGNLNRIGEVAVVSALRNLPAVLKQANGIRSIAYVQNNGHPPVYTWPSVKDAFHEPSSQMEGLADLPFGKHEWTRLKLYRGSWGPVVNVQFQPIAALMVRAIRVIHRINRIKWLGDRVKTVYPKER